MEACFVGDGIPWDNWVSSKLHLKLLFYVKVRSPTFFSGIESVKDSTIPAMVTSLEGIRIRSIACGRQHTVAIAENGSLFTWGKNSNGQCGLGHTNNVLSPVCVSSLLESDVRVLNASAGAAHTICTSEAGVLFSFGRGDEGQLGLGDDGSMPARISVSYVL